MADLFSSQYAQPYAIAVLIRAILYGVYFATFVHCCWLVYNDHRQKLVKGPDRKLLSITIFIFIFLTISLAVTFQILLDVFQNNARSAILSIVKIAIENAVILITNAVLIYRCWIVYTDSYPWTITFVPLVLWISALVCSIIIEHLYTTLLHTTPTAASLLLSRQVPRSLPFWVVFYVLNIAINIYATCGIIHRITQVARSFVLNSRKLYMTCKILAYFGCLYMVTTLLSLISVIPDSENGLENTAVDTMSFALDSINLMVPGITFNLIQILVHQERDKITSVNVRMRNDPNSPRSQV